MGFSLPFPSSGEFARFRTARGAPSWNCPSFNFFKRWLPCTSTAKRLTRGQNFSRPRKASSSSLGTVPRLRAPNISATETGAKNHHFQPPFKKGEQLAHHPTFPDTDILQSTTMRSFLGMLGLKHDYLGAWPTPKVQDFAIFNSPFQLDIYMGPLPIQMNWYEGCNRSINMINMNMDDFSANKKMEPNKIHPKLKRKLFWSIQLHCWVICGATMGQIYPQHLVLARVMLAPLLTRQLFFTWQIMFPNPTNHIFFSEKTSDPTKKTPTFFSFCTCGVFRPFLLGEAPNL